MAKDNDLIRKFRKHQTSKYGKYCATMADGVQFQATTQKRLTELIAQHLDGGITIGSESELFDPKTGKPIK